MSEHLSPETLSDLVKNPSEHDALLSHLALPCPECEQFLADLGGGQQRAHLVAVLTARAKKR